MAKGSKHNLYTISKTVKLIDIICWKLLLCQKNSILNVKLHDCVLSGNFLFSFSNKISGNITNNFQGTFVYNQIRNQVN